MLAGFLSCPANPYWERVPRLKDALVDWLPPSPSFLHVLPFFFLLVHGDTTGPQRHHKEQSSDDWHRLEEVVLKEVMHGLVGWDRPEGIEVDVDGKQPDDQGQSS